VGLGYRDLLSGAFIAMWSVAALADELRECRPQLASTSALLLDDQQRTIRLRAWLSRHRIANGLSEQDIDNLASDPPLFLYVLFEAAHDMDGKRLGVLGSVILAETLYKALQDASSSGRMQTDRLAGTFEQVCEIAFGQPNKAASIEQCIPKINSMANLISFVAEEFEDKHAAIPFV
jgi:hypothetical protein